MPISPSTASEVYLLGQGIAYSASPAMQNAGFRAAGLSWTYRLLDVPGEGLAEAVGRLRRPEVAGANVTIPHKLGVMDHLDVLAESARVAGSVNVVAKDGDRLVGHNTDAGAIAAAIGDLCTGPLKLVVVLGGGGSARAVSVAAAGSELVYVLRRPEASRGLPGRVLGWGDPAWLELVHRADLLVNATPQGRAGELPVPPDRLPGRGAVLDLVYISGGTPLVRAARAAGRPVVDGWEILLWQGAAAFELWTGRPAPVEAMRSALDG